MLRVEKAGVTAFKGNTGETSHFAKAVIQVQTVYKGELSQLVDAYANDYWGPPFTQNEEFIIYANFQKGK